MEGVIIKPAMTQKPQEENQALTQCWPSYQDPSCRQQTVLSWQPEHGGTEKLEAVRGGKIKAPGIEFTCKIQLLGKSTTHTQGVLMRSWSMAADTAPTQGTGPCTGRQGPTCGRSHCTGIQDPHRVI